MFDQVVDFLKMGWFPIGTIIVLLVCIQLSRLGKSVGMSTGIFAAGKAVLALVFGFNLFGALIYALIASSLGYLYFWLLRRTEGSVLWWLVVAGGIALIP